MEVIYIVIGLALLGAFIHPRNGLAAGAVVLFFLALVTMSVAKGAIHESAAATLAVGAFICAGLAGVIHALGDLKTEIIASRAVASPKTASISPNPVVDPDFHRFPEPASPSEPYRFRKL